VQIEAIIQLHLSTPTQFNNLFDADGIATANSPYGDRWPDEFDRWMFGDDSGGRVEGWFKHDQFNGVDGNLTLFKGDTHAREITRYSGDATLGSDGRPISLGGADRQKLWEFNAGTINGSSIQSTGSISQNGFRLYQFNEGIDDGGGTRQYGSFQKIDINGAIGTQFVSLIDSSTGETLTTYYNYGDSDYLAAPRGSSMTTTIDSFTEVGDTPLANHTANTGESWLNNAGYEALQVDGGADRVSSSSNGLGLVDVDPLSANYTVSATVNILSGAESNAGGVVMRHDTVLASGYLARFQPANDRLRVVELLDGGGNRSIGTVDNVGISGGNLSMPLSVSITTAGNGDVEFRIIVGSDPEELLIDVAANNPLLDIGKFGAWVQNTAGGTTSDFEAIWEDAAGSPTLTTPYTTIVLDRGTSGSINLGANWTGASTFSIKQLPFWMTQSGDTGTVNYTNVQWGGKNSDNTIGGGVWNIEVQAIDSTGLLTTETSIWLYVRP